MAKRVKEIDNLHITGYEELPTPALLKDEFALRGDALKTVTTGHRAVTVSYTHLTLPTTPYV